MDMNEIVELDKEALLKLYPEYHTVLGPYLRKDNRKQVKLYGNKISKTISYPKALVEVHLNTRLREDDTVDHKDRNKQNDSIENLVVRRRKEHCKLDAVYVEVKDMNCSWCSKKIKLSRGQHDTRSLNKAGPFCSKSCAGHYGKSIQLGATPTKRQTIHKRYYQLEK
jgi:hypothetical protein